MSLGDTSDGSARLPEWTRDELLLALDVYMATWRDTGYSARTPEVVRLSEYLRNLEVFRPEVRARPRFRNPHGVALKMHNFSAINPDKSGIGMSHGARGDQQVWDEWAHRPKELRVVAEAIRAAAHTQLVVGETGEAEEYEADEGRLLYRKHRRYERDRELVRKKKRAVLSQKGRLICSHSLSRAG